MSKRGRTTIDKFDGVALDVHRARLPNGLFQTDLGGDRHQRGSWQTRRGMLHTTVPKQTGPVVSIIGFNLPGATTALTVLSVVSSSAVGSQDVTTQGTTSATGYGGQGYGVGGYGG